MNMKNHSPLPRGRNDVDAEEERKCHDIGKSHRLRASAVPSRDTTLDLSTMSDDKLIGENNEDVRRGRRVEVNADEQRERRGGDRDGDVPSIEPGASRTYDMSNHRSSAASVRGSNLWCLDEDSDDTVEAAAMRFKA